jgi:hypothetical protein
MLSLLAADTKTTLDFFKANQTSASPLPFSQGADSQQLFGTFIGQVLEAVMVIALIAVLIFLVWGGIEWITSGGEKSKIEAARNKMTGAIIGLIVLASSLGIYMLIQRFIGVELFTTKRTTTTSTSKTTTGTTGNSGIFKTPKK